MDRRGDGTMDDLTLSAMQQMQAELQEKYADRWGGLSPQAGRSHLLWMLAEAGEAAQIIKKEGDRSILEDHGIRARFVEELCDVYMYLASTAMCYGITPQELTHAFQDKHRRNMGRW